MKKPFLQMPARLAWRKRYGEIIFYPDAPCVTFSLTPVFPGCSDKLGDPNEFVLLPGQDAEVCHRSGEAFTAMLRRCLGEGKTAPDVEVRYVRCEVPSADTGLDG